MNFNSASFHNENLVELSLKVYEWEVDVIIIVIIIIY